MLNLLLTATTSVEQTIGQLTNNANVQGAGTGLDQKINQVGATGFSLIQKVGIFAAVIVFVIAGIGFLLASGQERDDKKKGLVMKVVGIVLIVGATGIVTAIATLSNSLFSSTATTAAATTNGFIHCMAPYLMMF